MRKTEEDLARDAALRAAVARILDELADGCVTTADVAAKLYADGCRGDIGMCATCPGAKWISKRLPAAGYPDALCAVWSDRVGVWMERPAADTMVEVPLIIKLFVTEFDNGIHSLLRLPASSTQCRKTEENCR